MLLQTMQRLHIQHTCYTLLYNMCIRVDVHIIYIYEHTQHMFTYTFMHASIRPGMHAHSYTHIQIRYMYAYVCFCDCFANLRNSSRSASLAGAHGSIEDHHVDLYTAAPPAEQEADCVVEGILLKKLLEPPSPTGPKFRTAVTYSMM